MRSLRVAQFLVIAVMALAPRPGLAQATSGSIAGVVKDTTGAVLPGVTVEAASPALIEKVRSVTTDTQGQFKIVDLRPGTYSVTFTLPGFSTVKREGLELTTGFTATANADMKIGSLEETITVTSQSPIVDIQNVTRQEVLSREVLDSVPTGKTIQGYATLSFAAVVPPAGQDVGGNTGEFATGFGVHGGRANDLKLQIDGMNFNYALGTGSGGGRNFVVNQVSTEEVTLGTDNMSAETESGGVQLNVVPKEGSNRFKLYSLVSGTNSSLQADNLSDALRARNLISGTPVKRLYDFGVGLGGPIKHDKVWFYTGNRWWGTQQTFGGIAGGYFNKTQGTMFYTPDFSRPAFNDRHNQDNNVRLTWQATAKNKLSVAVYSQDDCTCYANSQQRAPEASTMNYWYPNIIVQGNWNYPLTSRLLLQAGMSHYYVHTEFQRVPGVSLNDIGIFDQSLGFEYNAHANIASTYGLRRTVLENQRFSASYVTGSHAFKTGFLVQEATGETNLELNQNLTYTFLRAGVPSSLTQYAFPSKDRDKLMPNLGAYAQDQWTIRRLTLNAGVRFDWIREYVPANSLPAGSFVPARDFPEVKNVPNWKDISPRFGGSYDLFGNGKTALKASVGRYVAPEATSISSANNPINATVTSATRTWGDANGDFVPDCDLTVITANGECGALNNVNFGRTLVTTTYDPDLLVGWGKRPASWEGSASIQQELRPGLAVFFGYYRRWFQNFTVTDNLAVTPADYNPYCVTAPLDSRLPGGGGNQLCGLYDISPGKFGQVNNLVALASKYGDQTEVYNGFDLGLNWRFGKGGLINGGFSTGQTVTDNCFAVDSPQQARPGYCHTTNPWSGQAQTKFSVVYPLPLGLQTSGTVQYLPGVNILANRAYTSAQIAPSLGRNLAAGANGTATVAMIEPFTQWEDRITQVDARVTKIFRMGGKRIQGMFDLYNIFNANSVLEENFTYGAAWLQPRTILGGRLVKFGAQIDF